MKYYTSDLHLSHKNIIKYENRPFQNVDEMDVYMVYKWNNGDFSFCNREKSNELFEKLNGQKFPIKGKPRRFLINAPGGKEY